MIEQILTNKVFLSVAVATGFSQIMKTALKLIETEKLDITKLWDTGGMPSSHAALASSLFVAVYLSEGMTTLSIAVFFLCMIVIRDAFGLRKEAGEQAKILNKIIIDFKLDKRLNVRLLKEIVGHNSTQVIVGIIIGALVSYVIYLSDLNFLYPFLASVALIVLRSLYYALPGLISNMMPIFVKNTFKPLAIPVDFGLKLRGKRIFGDHKTIRGFVFGIIGGIVVGLFQYSLQDVAFFRHIGFIEYTLAGSILIGAVFGFAALFGDAVKSFFKRQVGVEPGKPFIPFDQVDYILGIILFSFFFTPMTIGMAICLLLIGPVLSVLVTKIGYFLKFRDEKW